MTMTQSKTLPVALKSVRKAYRSSAGETEALQPVDLEIAPGEFLSVVGPSGCGKTTMLMMTAGLVPTTDGVLTIGDRVVDSPVTETGIVFQQPVLLDWRRAIDNVLLQIEMRGLDRKQFRPRAMELLEQVGLKGFERHYPHELSGGMRQRVAICRALIHDPPLLLMDEPFGALDALTRERLMLDLQRIWMETQKTVMFVTHGVSEAVLLSDRVVVMSGRPGSMVADIRIELERPRTLEIRNTPEFGEYAREIYETLASVGVFAGRNDGG
jgi:NitT/TauT family transport system ATP-binding protein